MARPATGRDIAVGLDGGLPHGTHFGAHGIEQLTRFGRLAGPQHGGQHESGFVLGNERRWVIHEGTQRFLALIGFAFGEIIYWPSASLAREAYFLPAESATELNRFSASAKLPLPDAMLPR